jgi:hypothetical protein
MGKTLSGNQRVVHDVAPHFLPDKSKILKRMGDNGSPCLIPFFV